MATMPGPKDRSLVICPGCGREIMRRHDDGKLFHHYNDDHEVEINICLWSGMDPEGPGPSLMPDLDDEDE